MDPRQAIAPDTPRPSALVLPVLGVPVHFDVDAHVLRQAIDRAYGPWREIGQSVDLDSAGPRIRVRLANRATANDATDAPGPIVVEPRPGPSLTIRQPGRIAGRASATRMAADIAFAADLLHDHRAVRDAIDTLTLFLLTRLDRQPIHAAAIARAGTGLVLAGSSGTGKSTLAYAAMRAGLRVLTDDAVYVQLRPALRVYGMARPLHLAPQSTDWFPELHDAPVVARPGGRKKRAIPLDPAAGPPVIERVGLCVLESHAGTQSVRPISPDEAVIATTADLDPGFDVFRDSIPDRIRAVATLGAWQVRVGQPPHAALPALFELIDALG
jgi:hypothetical protein